MYILREAVSVDDFEAFLQLKSQKDAVMWSGFVSAPKRESFKQYFINKVLNDPLTHVFFLCDQDVEGCPVVAYRQYNQVSDDEIEVRGTTIKKSYQGTDVLGTLNSLLELHYREKKYRKFSTWISEKNKASEINAVNMGWTKTDLFEVKDMPLLGGEHRFFKWVKVIEK